MNLQEQLLAAGLGLDAATDFDHHETDLYVRWAPQVEQWLKENYRFPGNIVKFRSQEDNQFWLEIPFAFERLKA
jgi:hypothetical protein